MEDSGFLLSTDFHQHLRGHTICSWVLAAGSRLTINYMLLTLHTLKSKGSQEQPAPGIRDVFQSRWTPTTWIHEVRKRALFDPAPPSLCQTTSCCLTGKWAQKQMTEKDKNQAAMGEWAPDNSIASLGSLLTSAEHCCNWPHILGALHIFLLLWSWEMKWMLPLARPNYHR